MSTHNDPKQLEEIHPLPDITVPAEATAWIERHLARATAADRLADVAELERIRDRLDGLTTNPQTKDD